jgi:hypothetical protein
MDVVLSTLLLLQEVKEKSTAEEGRDIIIAMLLVGLTFCAVIAIGQTLRYLGHRRAARKRTRRAY